LIKAIPVHKAIAITLAPAVVCIVLVMICSFIQAPIAGTSVFFFFDVRDAIRSRP
jgi:hypothetical protein